MPTHQTLETWVSVDGSRLNEYARKENHPPEGGKLIACWIPSEVGKDFVVHLKDSRQEARPATKWVFHVDGREVGNRVILSKIGRYASEENEGEFTDVPTDSGRRNLAFSESGLMSTETSSKDACGTGSPGEIRVQVFMTQVTYYGPPIGPPETVDLRPGIASERSGDGTASGVQLGSSSSASQPWVVDLFTVGAPVVQFIFWYRPFNIPQASSIVSSGCSTAVTSFNEGSKNTKKLKPVQPTTNPRKNLKRKSDARVGSLIKSTEPSTNRRRVLAKHEDVIDLTLDE